MQRMREDEDATKSRFFPGTCREKPNNKDKPHLTVPRFEVSTSCAFFLEMGNNGNLSLAEIF